MGQRISAVLRRTFHGSMIVAAAMTLTATRGVADQVPHVVASIQPLHGLVSAVMNGVGEPDLLVPPGASPHGFALRPSDAHSLSRADLVFWVGPGIEGFLERPLDGLARDSKVVALGALPDLHRLPVREGGSFDAHDHDHGHEQGHGDHDGDHDHAKHEHGGHDHEKHETDEELEPHVWLETHNAELMVQAIAAALSDADPAHAATYRRNAEAFAGRLDALAGELHEVLEPFENRPAIVFHDAYQHFEKQFHLRVVGSITINPEVPPGARQVSRLRSKIRDLGVRCVMAEPQFDGHLVEGLIADLPVRAGTADPLGAAVPAGPDHYPQMMRRLAAGFADCLTD